MSCRTSDWIPCVPVHIYRKFLFDFFSARKIRILAKIYYFVHNLCEIGLAEWQFLIDYACLIITDIWLWFYFQLPIIYALHCHLLCAAWSSNVGAWGMWACSLFLSFYLLLCRGLMCLHTFFFNYMYKYFTYSTKYMLLPTLIMMVTLLQFSYIF